MQKCRITVLKTGFEEDLAREYGMPGIGRCPLHKVGDTFVTDFGKPAGLCDEAWKAIQHYVFALVHGSDTFFGDWIRTEGVTINSCNDGLRPVIFKIERIEGPEGYIPPLPVK